MNNVPITSWCAGFLYIQEEMIMQRTVFILVHSLWCAGGIIVLAFLTIGLQSGVAAEQQPINFNHKIHASDNQIPCQYCHIYARRSYSSGVPPVNICIGCHGTESLKILAVDKSEADKVRQYWTRQEPIPWVKIHDLPDFVRFPHKKHINAELNRLKEEAGQQCNEQQAPRSLECKVKKFKAGGDERCTACHGEVKEMAVIKQVDKDFGNMGWCLRCHLQVKGAVERKTTLTTVGGWFNAKAQEKVRESKMELKNLRGYHNPNLTDCWTCHY